jgi:hypothetical protein
MGGISAAHKRRLFMTDTSVEVLATDSVEAVAMVIGRVARYLQNLWEFCRFQQASHALQGRIGWTLFAFSAGYVIGSVAYQVGSHLYCNVDWQ